MRLKPPKNFNVSNTGKNSGTAVSNATHMAVSNNYYPEGSRPVDPSKPASGNFNPEYGYTGGGGSNSLLSAYEKKQAEINRQQQAILQEKIKNSVSGLESQKGTINTNYDDAARQAYITKMQNQKALPDQLAAQGQSGGASETANLTIGTNYQNNLSTINNGRNQAINGVDTEINNIKAAGDIQAAELAASSAQSALDVYMQLAQQQASQQQQQQTEAKNDFVNTMGSYSNDYQAQINKVRALMQAGQTHDENGIPLAYIENSLNAARNEKLANSAAAQQEAEQQAFENLLKQQKLSMDQAKVNAYINKASKSNKGNTAAWNQAYKLYRLGIRTPQVLNTLGIDS